MASIRSKNTRPEMIVRKGLWRRGFRYRLNDPRLPGHPDLVLRKYLTVIFVNGCFWHGHEGCKLFKMPKSNIPFWEAKINRNRERDRKEREALIAMGWHCVTVWECDLVPKVREITLDRLAASLEELYLRNHKAKRTYSLGDDDRIPLAAEDDELYK